MVSILFSLTLLPLPFVAQSAVKATFLASAIRKCGGNEEKGNTLYNAYGSNGQVCLTKVQSLGGFNSDLQCILSFSSSSGSHLRLV